MSEVVMKDEEQDVRATDEQGRVPLLTTSRRPGFQGAPAGLQKLKSELPLVCLAGSQFLFFTCLDYTLHKYPSEVCHHTINNHLANCQATRKERMREKEEADKEKGMRSHQEGRAEERR